MLEIHFQPPPSACLVNDLAGQADVEHGKILVAQVNPTFGKNRHAFAESLNPFLYSEFQMGKGLYAARLSLEITETRKSMAI